MKMPYPINSNINYILIDSNTFNKRLIKDDKYSQAILDMNRLNSLCFVRTPKYNVHNKLKNIKEYKIKHFKYGKAKDVFIDKNDYVEINVDSRFEDMEDVAQIIYNKKEVSNTEIKRIEPIIILSTQNSKKNNCIFITENDFYLKNEVDFVNIFPNTSMNFLTVENSALYIDYYLKNKNKFMLRGYVSLSKWLWYWISMRVKLPHYNVDIKGDNEIINSLAERVVFALMSLDQIGINYYKDYESNSIQYEIYYHFNYLIALIVGIFDSLALLTNNKLNINFAKKEKINLLNKNFLREIRCKNKNIRDYITYHKTFINMMNDLRNEIIHRKLSDNVTYGGSRGIRGYHVCTYYDVIDKHIVHLNDKMMKHSNISEWGILKFFKRQYIEPFNFSLKAMRNLMPFIDNYLKLLSYPEFSGFTINMNKFDQYHIGF